MHASSDIARLHDIALDTGTANLAPGCARITVL
jgi:hypothetical protein